MDVNRSICTLHSAEQHLPSIVISDRLFAMWTAVQVVICQFAEFFASTEIVFLKERDVKSFVVDDECGHRCYDSSARGDPSNLC